MSGRKQHFIPQSLLRGFAKSGKGKKPQVAVYPYAGSAFLAATDGIGAKRHFYSELDVEGMVETLDDRITKHETPLAEVLVDFRSRQDAEAVDGEKAAALVTHLVVRNDHFRKIAISAGATLFSGFEQTISDQNMAAKLLGVDGDKPGQLLSDSLNKLWDENGPLLAALGFDLNSFRQFAFQMAKNNFSKFHTDLLLPMKNALSDVSDRVTGIAADSQIRALEQDLTPEKWVEKLGQYDWNVRHITGGCILPDCVAICVDSEGDSYPLIFSEDGPREFVVMPIASDRVLVGAMNDDRLPSNLNFALARCSWDFFVACRKDVEFEQLTIEQRVHMQRYIDHMVERAINESTSRP